MLAGVGQLNVSLSVLVDERLQGEVAGTGSASLLWCLLRGFNDALPLFPFRVLAGQGNPCRSTGATPKHKRDRSLMRGPTHSDSQVPTDSLFILPVPRMIVAGTSHQLILNGFMLGAV